MKCRVLVDSEAKSGVQMSTFEKWGSCQCPTRFAATAIVWSKVKRIQYGRPYIHGIMSMKVVRQLCRAVFSVTIV